MTRFTAIPVLLVACLTANPGRSAPPDRESFVIGNRAEPNEDQLASIAKMFCADMRTHHGDKNGNALRAYIDPRHLKKHNLTDRDLSMQMSPVWNIRDIQVADDNQTVYCVVEMKANATDKEPVREVILLRITVHEKRMCLSPPKAPDPKTGSFVPWILRKKV